MHFPLKLYEIVQAGPAQIIAWSDSGKSFLVVNTDEFCEQVRAYTVVPKKIRKIRRNYRLGLLFATSCLTLSP